METITKWESWENMETNMEAFLQGLESKYKALQKERGALDVGTTAAFYTYIGAQEAWNELIKIYWTNKGGSENE
mgnify:CR=1 FL=1